MTPRSLSSLLRRLRPAQVPVMISGPPGVGKSAIVRQVAESLSENHLDIRPLLHDPSDFRFPIVERGEHGAHVRWVQSLFPASPLWRGVIMLDELPACPPLIQAALYGLILERHLGDYTLPPGAWVVAAGNRQEDRAGAGRQLTPLVSRMVQLDLACDVDEWCQWAASNSMDPSITGFIRFCPSALHEFDPARSGAFPCPRTWDMLSQCLGTLDECDLLPVSAGLVGSGRAAEWVSFRSIYQSLPDPAKVLQDPLAATVPTDLSVRWALVEALGALARKGTSTQATAAVKYSARLPAEAGAVLMVHVGSRQDAGRGDLGREFAGACKRYGDAFAK